VLAEASTLAGGVRYVILGFGINVMSAAYPPEIADRATSLERELGRQVDRGLVLAETLAGLASRLDDLPAGHFPAVLDRWRALSPSSVGRRVEVTTAHGWREAVTAGVDDSGALLAEFDGRIQRVIAGEIRWH
jgi:BirA family biotin operon repressor/biotin-[acetyl-CoA-carboxylase] ligase